MSKDNKKKITEIRRKLAKQGWKVEKRGKGYKATPPEKASDRSPVFFHETPSDYRAVDNLRSLLKRRGADLD